jgi:hypothetical protein
MCGGRRVDNEKNEKVALERAFGEESDESLQTADEYISLSVVTIGLVAKLEHVSLAATVAEVVNRVRREAATDWSDIAVILRSGSGEPRTLSHHESLREAGVKSGDTLVFAHSVTWGSGWQEVALFMGTSASAGVIGGAAYDLLKSTLRAMAGRWQKHRSSTSAPSLSRDEALRIAQACLSISAGIEDPRDLRALSIAPDATSSGGSETWIVSFILPDRSVEVKVSVPAEGPEHAMVLIDHRPGGSLPESHRER